MSPKVERIIEGNELAEGPHWDATKQCLYFVDVFGKAINRYVPATKKHTRAMIGTNTVSIVIPLDGVENKFVISLGRKLYTVSWDGESNEVSDLTEIGEVDDNPDTLANRLNDGKVDPTGRLWVGTMGPEPEMGYVLPHQAGLFSIDSSKQLKKHLSGISTSNGMAWSSDQKKFYYIDSGALCVKEYEVELKYGSLSNEKIIFTLEKHNIPGFPDGMAIDTDGNLWVAIFNGYRVIKIDPRRPETLLQTIDIPSKQVTSLAFGGPNLDELYVTSARLTIDGKELSSPDDGAVFRVTELEAKGFPGVSFKFN